MGRDRKLASIGVHDLASVTRDISYRTVGPEELAFEPLAFPGTTMTPREILTKHPKGTAYAHLLENHALMEVGAFPFEWSASERD